MTEVPEHLLARSKAAKAKAAGGDAGGSEPPATPGEAPGTGVAASAVEPAGGAVAPAAAAPAPVEVKPVPPYVAAAQRRKRIPAFAIPALAALPVWALVYAGALTVGGSEDPELELGAQVYSSACAGCHGSNGEGGTGRALDEVLLTFPEFEDHVAWVVNGSPEAGTPYGSPDRPGGQRISQSGGFAAMPGFGDELDEEEIRAVTRYEREVLGGGEPEPSAGDSADGSGEEAGVQEPGGEGEGPDPAGTDEVDEAESQGGDLGGGSNASTSGDDAAPSSGGGETDGNVTGGGGAGSGTGGSPGR